MHFVFAHDGVIVMVIQSIAFDGLLSLFHIHIVKPKILQEFPILFSQGQLQLVMKESLIVFFFMYMVR